MNAQPDWDDLRLFLAVARAGSFTAASEPLGMHHTTVARRMERLETQLRTRLVDRQARGVVLTPAGEALMVPARRVEEEVLAASRAVAGHDQQLTGTIRMTTTPELVSILAPALVSFRARYPRVTLHLDAHGAVRDLSRREADVALRASVSPPDDAVATEVGPILWAVHARRGLEADAGWVGLGPELGHLAAHRAQAHWFGDGPPVVTASSVDTLVRLVGAGLGRGLVPCFAARGDERLVRETEPEALGGAVWLLVHVDLRRVARVRALVKHLRGVLDVGPGVS